MEDLIKLSYLHDELVAIPFYLGIAALSGLIIFAFAKRAKLLQPSKLRADWPKLLLASLFIPAIPEEILFRGLWYRDNFSMIEIFIWVIITTIIFVSWHIFQGMTFLKAQRSTFLNPWFLACAAVLGIANCAMIMASSSIWPAIIFHWLLVFIWQASYGGVVISQSKRLKP